MSKDKTTYTIGDTVSIRGDLKPDTTYGNDRVVPDMVTFCNEKATITDVRGEGMFSIDLDGGAWNWTTEMFNEPASAQLVVETDGELAKKEMTAEFEVSKRKKNRILPS